MSDRGNVNWDKVRSTSEQSVRPGRVRKFVDVVSLTTSDGHVTPMEVRWDDGTRYIIDKVTDRRQAHSLRAGGAGMRYTIRVNGHTTYLFYDDYRGRWFVEAKC